MQIHRTILLLTAILTASSLKAQVAASQVNIPIRTIVSVSNDAFFDRVKVNDDDAAVRENRLKLLNEIRAATRAVADFSKIQD